jgi:hypothetical protein
MDLKVGEEQSLPRSCHHLESVHDLQGKIIIKLWLSIQYKFHNQNVLSKVNRLAGTSTLSAKRSIALAGRKAESARVRSGRTWREGGRSGVHEFRELHPGYADRQIEMLIMCSQNSLRKRWWTARLARSLSYDQKLCIRIKVTRC